jgi:hypothetical protein
MSEIDERLIDSHFQRLFLETDFAWGVALGSK